MTVEAIFAELHDWTTWPEPPERPRRPFSPAELRPAVLIPMPAESLRPWVPPAREDAED